MDADAWDEQYRSGKWDYLRALEQVPRYAVLAAWISSFDRPVRIIDIGCGEGRLLEFIGKEAVASYEGLDFSIVAIERARTRWSSHEGCQFRVKDANGIVLEDLEDGDVVVFNEVLYCLADPVGILHRALNGSRTALLSVTDMHRDTAILLFRVYHTELVESISCSDLRRSKTWILGMFRGGS